MIKYPLSTLQYLADAPEGRRHVMLAAPDSFIDDYFRHVGRPRPGGFDDHVTVADALGYIPVICTVMPTLDLAGRYDPALAWKHEQWSEVPYTVTRQWLDTPEGPLVMQDRFRPCAEISAHAQLTTHDKRLITTDRDVRAYAWYVRSAAATIVAHRDRMIADTVAEHRDRNRRLAPGAVLEYHLWMPHSHVIFHRMEQDDGLVFMHEHSALTHELFDAVQEANRVWIDAAFAAEFHTVQTAIWGYEIFSPKFHYELVLPYGRDACERTRARGGFFWVHCCGKLKHVIENGFYQRMGVDILECLNYPPCGDVDDWPATRRLLPNEMITKGNLEDSLLLNGPIDEIKRKTLELLREQQGTRHLFATANGFLLNTPIPHVQAMLATIHAFP